MNTSRRAGIPGGLSVENFPLYPEQIKRLINSHKKLKEHPLYLAVWFDTDDKKDIKILEAVGNFPEYDEKNELFTTEFTSTSEFLILAGGQLILSLASPVELRSAISRQYPLILQIQKAFGRNAAETLYCKDSVRDILRNLKNEK